jgi:hypothetical protein
MIHYPFSKLIMPATALLVALSPFSSWSTATDAGLEKTTAHLAALKTADNSTERAHAIETLKDWKTRLGARQSGTLDVIAPKMESELARLKKEVSEEGFDATEWAKVEMAAWASTLKVGKKGGDGTLVSALSPAEFGKLHGQVMMEFRRIYLGLADEVDRNSAD